MGIDRQTILQHFRDEAEEHLAALAKALLSLESQGPDPQIIQEMLRRAHSLKGSAKVMGAEEVERLTHAFESVLSEMRGQNLALNADVGDVLLAALDAVRSCVGLYVQGRPVEEKRDILARLLALASSSRIPGDKLSSAFPGLDRELREVLTEYQKSQLLAAAEGRKACWEIEWELPEGEFARNAEPLVKELKELGEVVSLSSLSPRSEGTLRFKFLLATRESPEKVKEYCRKASLGLIDPAQAPAAAGRAGPLSPREEAYAKKRAKLVEQFITKNAEALDQFGKLMLFLEERPEDPDLLNQLFRWAHNLKGSGMTFGLPAISVLSHQVESLLGRLQDKTLRVSPQLTDALLRAVDTFKELFEEARAGKLSPDRALPVLKDLAAVAELKPAAPAEAVSLPTALSVRRMESQESIRVKLDKLESLVRLSSVMTVSRNSQEAAVKEIEEKTDLAKEILRRWEKLREDFQFLRRASTDPAEGAFWTRLDGLGGPLKELQSDLESLWNRFGTATLYAARTVEALQSEMMRIRMLPVSLLFDMAPRLVRDLTRDNLKKVRLNVVGEQTEVDKKVLESMADPLVHLLRNAVDHGIETLEERSGLGKAPVGTIELKAEQQGSQIVVTVSDDGRGMDPKLILRKAVQRGLVSASDADKLSPEAAYSFIFQSGFSTKEEVTEISGRGVGMDVVKSSVEALKGRIEIDSAPGRGTAFVIRLPLSIAILQIVLVECAGQTLGLPTDSVLEIVRVTPEEMQTEDGKACLRYRERTIPVASLAHLLALEGGVSRRRFPVAVVRGMEGVLGLAVDGAVDEQTVVLQDLGRLLNKVPHLAGGTLLPDGRVCLILDAASLVSSAIRRGETWTGGSGSPSPSTPAQKTLLVVDDSLTTRELLRGLLEAAGYKVVTARNGREALEALEDVPVDLLVSDISMPEMDGYQLISAVKSSRRFSRLPVVLVTALSKEEERQKGLEAGADAYVVKGAFDQTGLLERVAELARRNG